MVSRSIQPFVLDMPVESALEGDALDRGQSQRLVTLESCNGPR